jgi:uncharacterized protein (TIGR03118 family)
VLAVDNSASGAVYKSLTILAVPAGGTLPAGQYLVAANFHSGNLDVFDQSFKSVALPSGAIQDPNRPAGFAPFNAQSVGGNLYVTYAKQDGAKHDDVAGPGNGFVDVYSTSGFLLRRLGGDGVQAELNSPWGVVQAPPDFGPFSNDILVGNFGDSQISAFDPAITVEPYQQGKRIGLALMRDVVDHGRSRGIERIRLPVGQAEFFRRVLKMGCRTIKVWTLMTLGPYEPPRPVWMPSVLY